MFRERAKSKSVDEEATWRRLKWDVTRAPLVKVTNVKTSLILLFGLLNVDRNPFFLRPSVDNVATLIGVIEVLPMDTHLSGLTLHHAQNGQWIGYLYKDEQIGRLINGPIFTPDLFICTLNIIRWKLNKIQFDVIIVPFWRYYAYCMEIQPKI